ncbi:MAG: hypothetical protein ACLFU0_08705 [Alphaproteobacteria bacterium]
MEPAAPRGQVSRARQVLGWSRDGFDRFRDLDETGGEPALLQIAKSRPNPKNRVAAAVEPALGRLGIAEPAPPRPLGRGRVADGSAGLLAADGTGRAPSTRPKSGASRSRPSVCARSGCATTSRR